MNYNTGCEIQRLLFEDKKPKYNVDEVIATVHNILPWLMLLSVSEKYDADCFRESSFIRSSV